MSDYHAPRRDQQFVLETLAGLDEVLALPANAGETTSEVMLMIHWQGGQHSPVADPQAQNGRAWMQHVGRSARNRPQHANPMV
ncbi:acyl-CoA dehydrogenase N-terminal domain-containing protein [Trinickia mobilis]|uniref:acyl-CoA dehydrogenase N-terminal domain-containing protein n=1 Tax=Trinickia mobilis TaxID=2816356 RepID=UPI001A8D0590|nr:acyl-CoA dehydrogenase N-terminal domain-containing protein [Trinickia mobilis]